MKTLIYGTGYFYDDACVELCKLWARLVRKLDPKADVVLIDAHSPFDPAEFLDDSLEIKIYRFDDNIGHLARNGRDGAGRSFIKGLELARDGGYAYAVHYEADVLFAHSCEHVIRERVDLLVSVAAMPLKQYDFPGFELSFWDIAWVKDSDFIERYDWQSAPRFPIPEIRIKQLCGNNLFLLPFTGMRNDQGYLTSANLANHFPYGPPDWLTRIVHPELAYRFLQLNKIDL